MKNILAFVSGKGGVGKSTCALGTATALCKKGHKVLLIDLDAGLRCLDIMTGVDEGLVFDLSDVLLGRPLSEAVLPVPKCKNLFLLAAPAEYTVIDGPLLRELLLSAIQYDYIILDFSAGTDFPFVSDISDIVDFIAVTCGDAVSVRDCQKISDYTRKFGANCRLIINKYTLPLVKQGVYGGIDDIIDRSGVRLLGIVPYDAQHLRNPFAVFKKHHKKAKAFGRIASRIYGNEIPLQKFKKIEKGK